MTLGDTDDIETLALQLKALASEGGVHEEMLLKAAAALIHMNDERNTAVNLLNAATDRVGKVEVGRVKRYDRRRITQLADDIARLLDDELKSNVERKG